MKEKLQSSVINEKVIREILRLIFVLSLHSTVPNVSDVRQFVCSRLNLSSEEFAELEKALRRSGLILRHGGRKLLLTPKGVLYVLYSEHHER